MLHIEITGHIKKMTGDKFEAWMKGQNMKWLKGA